MNYIYENKYSIPGPLCDDIIKMFENENYYDGVTVSGVNKTVKSTSDFIIPHSKVEKVTKWEKIEKFLTKELHKNLQKYLSNINNSENYLPKNNNEINGSMLKGINLTVEHFMIQKYERQKGFYIYHDDFHVNKNMDKHRVITFLWYLNTVDEGGETEFWDSLKIKPEKGKLILFPSFWCFPHRARIPISNNKYIITGWFYKDHV